MERRKKEKGKKRRHKEYLRASKTKTKAQQVTENGDETIAHRLSLARPRGNMAARERRCFSFAATKRRKKSSFLLSVSIDIWIYGVFFFFNIDWYLYVVGCSLGDV